MSERIQIECHETIDEGILAQIRFWANEVLERAPFSDSDEPRDQYGVGPS